MLNLDKSKIFRAYALRKSPKNLIPRCSRRQFKLEKNGQCLFQEVFPKITMELEIISEELPAIKQFSVSDLDVEILPIVYDIIRRFGQNIITNNLTFKHKQ